MLFEKFYNSKRRIFISLIFKNMLFQERINKHILDKQFAVWRVDAPWLPRTKKAQGVRLGGGKGSIHHYVTPVRAGRVILELGGHMHELEARAILTYMVDFLPFPTEFVTHEMLLERRAKEEDIEKHNQNPFDWDRLLKYNMQNCRSWLSPYDVLWKCKTMVYVVSSLPLTALILCVITSLLLHFDESTRTHCRVPNWLPSISAAVATYEPEKFIWRMFIGIHAGPRLVAALAYRNFLSNSPLRPHSGLRSFRFLCNFTCILHIMENLFLLGLTSVSSTEDHELHKLCFIGFEFCATIYMFLHTWLFHYSGRRRTTQLGEKSYEYKILFVSISCISMAVAGYLYYRHNAYCEPGIYTLFALAEYVIVFANVAFHSTLYFDFYDRFLMLTSSGYMPLPMNIEKDT
ncbi:hypothetical protein WR25_21548 [Diploscapter pachys]|uniref:CWH43-like N-terminal domain-containing protein n=1 Tax=Diploscapter pachys TaxID=2018661 RepID=A0A2A2JNH4_9BILA|nr:hypothetical protein WR25_21548 [Diploscapter pachys]